MKTPSGVSIMPVLLMKNDDAELEGGHDKEGSGSTRSSPRWGEGRGFARRRLKRKPVLGERGGCHQQLGDHSHVAMCHQGSGLPLPSKKAPCSRKPIADRAQGAQIEPKEPKEDCPCQSISHAFWALRKRQCLETNRENANSCAPPVAGPC